MRTRITWAGKSWFVALLVFAAEGTATAGVNGGQLDGFYVPVRGWAETQGVSRPGEPPTQIGTYRIVLKREGWRALPLEEKRRIRRRLVLTGSLIGAMVDPSTSPPTEDHVMGTRARDGALYSAGDYLVIQAGDLSCSEGLPLDVLETINVVQGTGAYESLESGTLELEGVVNICPRQPDYGRNDFEVIPGAGGLTFRPLP